MKYQIKDKRFDLSFTRIFFVLLSVFMMVNLYSVLMPFFYSYKRSVFIIFMAVTSVSFVGAAMSFIVLVLRRPRHLTLVRRRTPNNHKCEICDRIIEKFEFHSYRIGRCIIGDSLVPYLFFVCFQAVLAACCLGLVIWLIILYDTDRSNFRLSLQHTVVTNIVYFMLFAISLAFYGLLVLAYCLFEMVLLPIYLTRLLTRRRLEASLSNKQFLRLQSQVKSTNDRIVLQNTQIDENYAHSTLQQNLSSLPMTSKLQYKRLPPITIVNY